MKGYDEQRGLNALVWPEVNCPLCGMASRELVCRLCGQELEACRDVWRRADGRAMSLMRYEGRAAEMVTGLKYGANSRCARALAWYMAGAMEPLCLPPDTVLTWVPVPRRRLWQRGVDHGRLLCGFASELTGLTARQLLVRTRSDWRTQQGLSASQRQENVLGAFRAVEPVKHPVVLVDDVYTTGATVDECIRQLLQAGAPQVLAITACRASAPDCAQL